MVSTVTNFQLNDLIFFSCVERFNYSILYSSLQLNFNYFKLFIDAHNNDPLQLDGFPTEQFICLSAFRVLIRALIYSETLMIPKYL